MNLKLQSSVQEPRLDTAAIGANVAGDVRNFPVAVALNTNNSDFNQARPDDADGRFSSEKSGPPLPHHIESWVRTNQSALIWVKLPLIRGN